MIGTSEVEEIQEPTSSEPLEMSKTHSYMSDHRFIGEVGTPSKLEEKE